MSTPAIRIENLSKMYRIGAQEQPPQTAAGALKRAAMSPIDYLRRTLRPPREEEIFWALRDISFEVKPGEVIGIIGRNGAGKSTLLKILSRITEPTSGRARINGRVGSLLEVGTGFHPELTGRENIYLNAAIMGMKRNEVKRKFDQIVDFSGVEKFIDTPVKRYSSGMYVRLAFAVAAHLEPEILIIDEVLAVGDDQFQKKCLGKMGEVAQEGRTVLFVSHNMAAVQNLCRRAVLLSSGSIKADGATQDTIESYLGAIEKKAEIDLATRKDRRGSGEILITNIDLLDEKYQPVNHAISGQSIIIRISYAVKKKGPFRNCRISLSINKNAITFILASSELVRNEELILQGNGFVECIIPELPLSKGDYYINPFLEANKTIQDWVEAATILSVIDGDFYGTGRNYPPGLEGQTVLVKHNWKW